MQKCSLCGGKVVNGRCEDCGMPIPPENRYTLRSETNRARNTDGKACCTGRGRRHSASLPEAARRRPLPGPSPAPGRRETGPWDRSRPTGGSDGSLPL